MRNFTILSSIDLQQRSKDLYTKLINLINSAEINQVHIVVAHNDRGGYFDKKIKEIENNKYVKVISNNFYEGASNQSLLRNISFQSVETDYVLLLDIDILFDLDLFQYLYDFIKDRDDVPFSMAPCLYLTKTGTRKILKNKDSMFDSYLNYNYKIATHLAMPSSVIMFRKKDFLKIEGFDEKYEGHGYEDFDFMIRLAKLYNFNFNINMDSDITYKAPLLVTGFRETLALFSLEALVNKKIAYHLYHKKVNLNYLDKRMGNKEYFLSKFKSNNNYKKEQSLLKKFIKLCSYDSGKIEKYTSLFDARPYHIKDNSLSRKFKKIVRFFYV